SVPTRGGPATTLAMSGMSRPSGLAMGPDCKSLFATGRLADNDEPALFELPLAGGAARVVYHGLPLVMPTGGFIHSQRGSWVMDHRALGKDGEGMLLAISSDGKATEVMSNLRMGTPGGVSLTAGGGTAVMPTRDADGNAQLTSVDIATGEVKQLPTPDMAYGAGLRTARNAGVFVIVHAHTDSIYSPHYQ